ncbi:hypothetical protein ACQ4PT_041140 [Festuca glaucescens]
MAKQVLEENEFANVSIRIVAPGELDGPRFNLPSTDELACLVVGELTVEAPKRDIIIRDEARLHFILLSNDDLRAESLQGLVDEVGAGRMDGSSVDIFTTFTCNPKWPEIAEALSVEPGQRPHNRADITVRVYHMKLAKYLASIKTGKAFGKAITVLHTVEFQKRGLPHAHILVWQDKEKRGEATLALIDSFISAEIPDPVEDPLGYALVAEFMMHGPCGEDSPKCPCMKDGLCSKKFPKPFQDETSIDESGFPDYRRRDNGCFVMKNKVRLDNRHVVPYNMALLKIFQAHLNVEWCNKTHVIKYLYKYVTKGPDYSKTLFERIKNAGDPDDGGIDEIEEYRACHYICAHDSFWRCYGTAHSRFKIPIDLDANGVCDIQRGTMLSSLIEASSLIIWDEALMTHRKCFEALDRSLRDVLSDHDPLLADEPFGGKVVVLGGDLRQILPRLAVQSTDTDVQDEAAAFARWVLSIGDGTVPAVARQGESDPTWITIPNEHLVRSDGDKITSIVESMYVDFLKRYCISFVATDATGEAEFVMFKKVAAGAVGKQLMNLMRQRYPGHSTVDELAQVARHDTTIPPEIDRLIGHKYKILVSISKKWNTGNNENLNFQVCRIEETYKPELPPLAFARSSGSAGASSSAGGSGSRLSPWV